MAYREIVTLKNEDILRKKCRPVTVFDDRLGSIIDDMVNTMRRADGVGIAAPQVGIIRRICVVETSELYCELVNPVIVEHSKETQLGAEGCLSIPGEQHNVVRPMTVTVEAFDRHGKPFRVTGSGFTARALCHEIDHLDGILYIDRAEKE